MTWLGNPAHARWLEAEGLLVERERLDRGYAHPHHLLAARRPAVRGASAADPRRAQAVEMFLFVRREHRGDDQRPGHWSFVSCGARAN